MSSSGRAAAAEIARRELREFLKTAEGAGIDIERLGRSLRLSQSEWQRWLSILNDAPLPPTPALPLLLRHLGYLTSRLDRASRHAYV